MTAACACTSPTGTKGEVMTTTRASDAYCSKAGLDATGILVGDLVLCANNQPRIMPGTRGGTLGVMVESSSTNQATYSEDLTHATWVDAAVGASAPTRAADQADSPANTATADRITFAATTSGQYSMLSHATVTGMEALSIYIKGVSGSGSLRLCRHVGAAWVGASCSYNNTTWTRCQMGSTTGGTTTGFRIGNSSDTSNCGASTSSTTEADVYLWGAQYEDNALGYATTYMPAPAGSAVTRQGDVVSFQSLTATSLGSFALSAASEWAGISDRPRPTTSYYLSARNTTGSRYMRADLRSTGVNDACFAGTTGNEVYASIARDSTVSRISCWQNWGATPVIGGYRDGVALTIVDSTGGFDLTDINRIYFGDTGTGAQVDAVIYNVCMDPIYTRCQ